MNSHLQTSMPETKNLLPEVAQLGWSGEHQLGKGVLFLGEGDDYPLYIKHEYAPEMTLLSQQHKSLITESMKQYNPETQVIVFYLEQVLIFDILKETGQTCKEFIKSLERPQFQPSNKPVKKRKINSEAESA